MRTLPTGTTRLSTRPSRTYALKSWVLGTECTRGVPQRLTLPTPACPTWAVSWQTDVQREVTFLIRNFLLSNLVLTGTNSCSATAGKSTLVSRTSSDLASQPEVSLSFPLDARIQGKPERTLFIVRLINIEISSFSIYLLTRYRVSILISIVSFKVILRRSVFVMLKCLIRFECFSLYSESDRNSFSFLDLFLFFGWHKNYQYGVDDNLLNTFRRYPMISMIFLFILRYRDLIFVIFLESL